MRLNGFVTRALAFAVCIGLVACGGDGSDGGGDNATTDGSPSVAANAIAVPPGDQCPAGGVEVATGIDENGNGLLDNNEIDDSGVICNGEHGADGRNSLLLVDDQVGDSCPAGGVRVRAGLDDNRDGALNAPDEVDDTAIACAASAGGVRLVQIGRYESGLFDEGAAEIVAHDPASQRLFVINAQAATVDVLSIVDPANPQLVGKIVASDNWPDAGGVNSVAVAGGLVAVAVENDDSLANGQVQIYNAADLAFRGQVDVGVLPDMVVFTPDGSKILVANEGQPASDYGVDPLGSVSIVDASDPDNPSAQTVGFAAFNAGAPRANELPEPVRVFGNFEPTALAVSGFTDSDPATLTVINVGATGLASGDFFTLASSEGDPLSYRVASISGDVITFTDDFDGDSEVTDAGAAGLTVYLHDGSSSVAQDLEPEYIAVSPDGSTAFVTLQENNAVATIDIASASVIAIDALGLKDYSIPGNGLDASNEDDDVNIRAWPLMGLYLPDSITAFTAGGQLYYATANEGDAREYNAYVGEVAIEDVSIDSESFPDADTLEKETNLGAINTPISEIAEADTDGDGRLDQLRVYGARSFTIWRADGTLVFDSGNDFEVITAQRYGIQFNNDNDESDPDGRSDNKGPEPEAITVAEFKGRKYAFIGLERIGGIMVYDVTNPAAATFVHYTNNRDFSIDIEDQIEDGGLPAGAAGDLGPESVVYIPAAQSPGEHPLLVVGSEVSGTTTIYRVVGP